MVAAGHGNNPPPSSKQTHQTLLQPVANGRALIFFFFSQNLAGPMRGDEGRPRGGSLQNPTPLCCRFLVRWARRVRPQLFWGPNRFVLPVS